MQIKEKTSVFSRAVSALVLTAAFVVVFFLGYFIRFFTLDPAAKTLQWVKSEVKRHYYTEIPEKILKDATMNDLFYGEEKLLDAYSAYYSPEAYAASRQTDAGNHSGIGLSFLRLESDKEYTLIYSVAGNSPAEACGLKRGMYLRGYGENASEVVYGGYTVAFSEFLSSRETGEEFVLLASADPDGETTRYTIRKADYVRNYVFYADSSEEWRYVGETAETLEKTESGYDFLPSGAAVIRLDSFSGGAAEQFAGMLKKFGEQGKEELYLDLRCNGGGSMSILSEIASYLCKDASARNFPVADAVYRNGKTRSFSASKNRYTDYLSGVKVYLLVNGNTASASEALAGAMLDYGTLDISDVFVAEADGKASSYGKGIMQTTYENVFTHEAVKLTTAKVCWPVSGNCIHGKGLTAEDGIRTVAAASNEYVEFYDGMLRAIAAA